MTCKHIQLANSSLLSYLSLRSSVILSSHLSKLKFVRFMLDYVNGEHCQYGFSRHSDTKRHFWPIKLHQVVLHIISLLFETFAYLRDLSFQVFGLGNKTYEHYNKVAIYVDKRLEELGATRVFELGLGDDDAK